MVPSEAVKEALVPASLLASGGVLASTGGHELMKASSDLCFMFTWPSPCACVCVQIPPFDETPVILAQDPP